MQSSATLALTALFIAVQVFAQSPYELERLDTPVSATDSAGPQGNAASMPAETVPAEILRHPISEKVRGLIRAALRRADAGDHKSAIAQLQLLRTRHPEAEGYVNNVLGVEYLHLEEYAEAEECFERAIALLPRDATNHADLALTFIGLNQLDRAEPELRRALDLDPRLDLSRQLLNALLASKNVQHARAE